MATNSKPPKFIKYVPAQAGAQPRVIKMIEVQKDPMDPTNFKLNQKVPRPPPSPPAPVMHSPPRKITAEEQNKWKIPPCVSSWKNPRGYTVPLDKRCAFNGRNVAQPDEINPKFAQLAETLSIGSRLHRERLEEMTKNEKLMAQKEKERNEEILRQKAQQAREERAAMQRGLGHGRDETSDDEDIDLDEVMERRKMREDRHKERVRNANIKASDPGRRTKLERQRERDISEQIALGTARPNTMDNDIHDQRLYSQSQGLGSGFGDDEDYAIYDKAWKSKESFSTNYRPSESILKEFREPEDDGEEPSSKSKTHANDDDLLEPIQFEKDDDDPLNLESILANIRKDPKKAMQQVGHASKRHKS